jgi:hypothetical protein
MGIPQAYSNYVNQDPGKSQTPFLTGVGREAALGAGGTVNMLGGVFTGDMNRFKQGAKDTGKSVLSAVTGQALRGMNSAPPAQYVGGTPEALQARYAAYQGGNNAGTGYQGQGVAQQNAGQQQLIDASGMAGQNYGLGLGLYGQGLAQGQTAQTAQATALQGLRGASMGDAGSVAVAQQTQGLQQLYDQNLASAGTDALSQRNAMNANAQAGLAATSHFAQLRAAEEQAAMARRMQAESTIAAMQGQNAQLGYGLQGAGLNAAQQAAGQYGQFGATQGQLGLGLGNLGLGTQQLYTGAALDTDRMQLDADTKAASAAQAAKGGIMGIAGKIIGGVMGGS